MSLSTIHVILSFFHLIIPLTEYTRNRGSSKKDKDETNDIMTTFLCYQKYVNNPTLSFFFFFFIFYQETKPDGTKDDRDNKVPAYAMNGSFMCWFSPLIDNKTTEEEVNKSPNIRNPIGYKKCKQLSLFPKTIHLQGVIYVCPS